MNLAPGTKLLVRHARRTAVPHFRACSLWDTLTAREAQEAFF